MAFFETQKGRLMREEDWTAQLLAEELYAMFGDDEPQTLRAPLTLAQDEGEVIPPLVLNFSDDNVPAIRLQRNGQDIGDFTFDMGQVMPPSSRPADQPPPPTTPGKQTPGTRVVIAQIVAVVSVTTYMCRIYPRGLTMPFEQGLQRVTALNISSLSEPFSVGTNAFAIKLSDGWYMELPVWMGPNV